MAAALSIAVSITKTDKAVHVHLPPREHETSSLECWCKPTISIRCDECAGDGAPCWKCEGFGWETLTVEQAVFTAETLIVLHR